MVPKRKLVFDVLVLFYFTGSQENLRIKKRAGLAKVFGTILCVRGALPLHFTMEKPLVRKIKYSLEIYRENGKN